MLTLSGVRAWIMEQMKAGHHLELIRRVTQGERLDELLGASPIAPEIGKVFALHRKALELFERLGDRQGAMSTVIALAYASWGPELHLPSSAKRIEEVRRLMSRMKTVTKESERALAEAQSLFGTQIYSRAKGFPDVALTKGEEAFHAARAVGDRLIEFASAGALALTHAEIGATDESGRWLERAAQVASEASTQWRSRQLQRWRGMILGLSGDAKGMKRHLERAVELATEQGRPEERCETLMILARESARLGAERLDSELLSLAERSAADVKRLMPLLPGRPFWGAQADASLSRVALARGAFDEAAEFGRAALAALDRTMTEDAYLDVLIPAAEAILNVGIDGEAQELRGRLTVILTSITQRIEDEDVRVRWFRSSDGTALTRLVGPLEASGSFAAQASPAALNEAEVRLLQLVVEGLDNSEIAKESGVGEESIAAALTAIYAKIGAVSRVDATAIALTGKLA